MTRYELKPLLVAELPLEEVVTALSETLEVEARGVRYRVTRPRPLEAPFTQLHLRADYRRLSAQTPGAVVGNDQGIAYELLGRYGPRPHPEIKLYVVRSPVWLELAPLLASELDRRFPAALIAEQYSVWQEDLARAARAELARREAERRTAEGIEMAGKKLWTLADLLNMRQKQPLQPPAVFWQNPADFAAALAGDPPTLELGQVYDGIAEAVEKRLQGKGVRAGASAGEFAAPPEPETQSPGDATRKQQPPLVAMHPTVRHMPGYGSAIGNENELKRMTQEWEDKRAREIEIIKQFNNVSHHNKAARWWTLTPWLRDVTVYPPTLKDRLDLMTLPLDVKVPVDVKSIEQDIEDMKLGGYWEEQIAPATSLPSNGGTETSP